MNPDIIPHRLQVCYGGMFNLKNPSVCLHCQELLLFSGFRCRAVPVAHPLQSLIDCFQEAFVREGFDEVVCCVKFEALHRVLGICGRKDDFRRPVKTPHHAQSR